MNTWSGEHLVCNSRPRGQADIYPVRGLGALVSCAVGIILRNSLVLVNTGHKYLKQYFL